jgi:hypothetical protein
MGDRKRGTEVSKFIKKNFTKISTVISVADGNFILAKEICNSYNVTVYDPKIRGKKSLKSKINVIGKPFFSCCKEKCDLVVGIHPDEATGEIIDYSIRTRTPCLVVPCCVVGKYANSMKRESWIKFLKNKLVQNYLTVSTPIKTV